MIAEDYVSFETAKLLKEKGFNEQTDYIYYYYEEDDDWCFEKLLAEDVFRAEKMIHCPSLAMAMKWLRKTYNISCRPRYDEVEDEKGRIYYAWFFDILSMNPYKTLVGPEQGYDAYEEAGEAVIKYCLENLI